jgi:hypothetical protein
LGWRLLPARASPEPESPKLQALAHALDAGDTLALPAFWQELARTHAPLIEEIPGRPQDVLYTFVWHAEPGQVALNVLFNGWFPRTSRRASTRSPVCAIAISGTPATR